MLTKMVNGETIVCSDEEEKNIRAYWALNDAYPEFAGCCAFDGVNPPYHIIEDARKTYISLCNSYCDDQIKSLSDQIEVSRENQDSVTEKSLMDTRKSIRKMMNPDVSAIQTVKELHFMLPK